MGSLSNLYISQSYQSLIHLATNNTASATLIDLQDGLGNSIGVSVNTGGDLYLSGSLTASLQQGYLLVGGANGKTYSFPTSSLVSNVNTSSLVTTASFNAYTASNDSKVNQLINATSSYAISSSVAAVDASQQSQINSLIAATGSYATTGSNTFTGQQNLQNNLVIEEPGNPLINTQFIQDSLTGKLFIQQSGANGVLFNNVNVAMAELTASLQQGYVWVGDSTNRTTLVATSSFFTTGSGPTDITSLNEFTASQLDINTGYNTFTSSANQRLTSIESVSGSWITESETASFARTNVDNNFTANQTFTNITAVSASFTYVQTTFETSSVIYSSGSNIFGDELTDIQTLSGSVKVQGSLTVNGTPVLTSSVDISGLVTTASFNAYTESNDSKVNSLINATASYANSASVALVDAGQQLQIDNLIAATGSYLTSSVPLTSLNEYTQSNDAKWNTLGGQTGSYVTSAITASSLVTASVNLNTITFTKGDATTFNITVDTGSAITTDITSLNAFTASQETKDTTLESVTASLQAFTASQQILNGTFTTTASFNSYTQSNDQRVSSLESNSASVNISISNINSATASLFTSASLALVTASFDNGTRNLTFTKGNTTQFSVNIPDVSGSVGTTIYEVVFTGENITKGDPLYISGSQGANPRVFKADAADPNKMPVTFVSNETIGVSNTTNAIVLGLIEGIDLTGYIAGQTIYVAEGGGWSTSLPSGSNSITQLLGVVTKGGSGGKGLVLNPGPAQLPGLDNGYLWVGGAINQPIEITTASFASSASFNQYTQSNDSKVDSLINATASYVTSAITASSLITASVSLNTITFTKGDASTFNITVDTGSGGGGGTISVQDEGTILGNATSFDFNGAGVTATLSAGTASITIPGGGGSIDTGSFATTGSNTFTGDQTFIDNGGNFFTITDASGSMMLVAKGFTSASAHMSASISGSDNLIFKTNNNTADTIISGSGNIFVNGAAPTAGFKRYIGGSNNIYNTTGLPQISGSMAISPTMGGNIGVGSYTFRGPVSSSAWTISNNYNAGTINIGAGAANNAEKLTAGLNISSNSIQGGVTIVANQTALTGSITIFANNSVNGNPVLYLSSSAANLQNNIINDTNFTLTNQYYTASLGRGQITVSRNTIGGISNTILVTGIADAGISTQPQFNNNTMGGQSNIIFSNSTGAGSNQSIASTIIFGNTLIVSASSNTNTTSTLGSAFLGRFNANDGRRNSTAGTIFSVGTGQGTGQRKTGFLIDSGSNTIIEGSLTVSGSTSLTGSITLSGSIITIDRSGNNTNTAVGLNALGMNQAGSQPLAIGNTISVAIGPGAMRYASGSNQNVAIGNNALLITSGSKNFAMGSEALSANTLGSSNIAIGTSALQNNTTGDSSTAIGDSSAQFASGSQNTFIGQYSGYNVTGSNNVIIGSYRGVAGEKISNNIILSDGQQNIKAQYSGSAWSFQDNIKLNKGTNKTTDIVSVNGSATVNNSLVTAASIILVTTQNSGTGPVYPAVVLNKGTGTFDIAHNFGSALDVAYMIINPT